MNAAGEVLGLEGKACRVCKRVLPLTEFYPRGGDRADKQSQCKQCGRAQALKHRDGHRARNRENPVTTPARCNGCGETKPADQFYRNLNTSRGLDPLCKPCKLDGHRWLRFKLEYGLTQESYNALIESQGGKCAICADSLRDGRDVHVDHCHATGRIRGILCFSCNTGIGKLRDSPELLRRALAYLESSK